MIGYVILALIGIVVVLLLAALVNTLRTPAKKADYCPARDAAREEQYARKLSTMVQCETVSVRGEANPEKFRAFHALMEKLYPTVFEKLEKHDIDGNLLMHWRGQTDKNPIMLMSHIDVVEASGEWTHAPFSGDIAQGMVWGRGAGDTKCSVMAFYQAVEELLKSGYVPPCDVYLSSSCTEEVGGDGAPKIVEYLKNKGVHLAMLCDEGGGIIKDPMPGVPGCFAMVGVFEKGIGNVRFVARSAGGHASAPKKNTPLARLGKLMAAVDKASPFTAKMSDEVLEMFKRLSPYANFSMRYLFSNMWLFKPLMVKVMPMVSAQAGAMLKTTIAFTMAQGSKGVNVIPQEASVVANLRFIPHQNAEESIARITDFARKFDIDVEVMDASDPSESVDINGKAFKLTEEAIAATFPRAGCTPYVVTGGTDARFYAPICDNCVRFSPVVFGPKQMVGMHGIDETIEVSSLPGAVDYYTYIIKNAGKLG